MKINVFGGKKNLQSVRYRLWTNYSEGKPGQMYAYIKCQR